ncbi:HNH endonuclease [Candidatus Micrarchaeota archaeon]|nr:HNH endonuclease [Candidatus Micrarchaeota archaeon]
MEDIFGTGKALKRQQRAIKNQLAFKPIKIDTSAALNPWGQKPGPERDSRRAFTKTQRNEILYQQDSKCAVCGDKLDPRDIELDHKKPWAAKGRTITENGRALCGFCHNKVTHKQTLKKIDKKPKNKPSANLGFGQSAFKLDNSW